MRLIMPCRQVVRVALSKKQRNRRSFDHDREVSCKLLKKTYSRMWLPKMGVMLMYMMMSPKRTVTTDGIPSSAAISLKEVGERRVRAW